MTEVLVKIWFFTNKLPAATRVFETFVRERELEKADLKKLKFELRNSGFIEASFVVCCWARNKQELVWSAINVMENLHRSGFYFGGSSHEDFFLLAEKISGSKGGIKNILIEVNGY